MNPYTHIRISILDITMNPSVSVFLSFHEYKHQDFDNIAESIFWKLKRIVSHEGLNIVSNHNDKVYWYNVMVILGSGGTTTESLNIIIGVKP